METFLEILAMKPDNSVKKSVAHSVATLNTVRHSEIKQVKQKVETKS